MNDAVKPSAMRARGLRALFDQTLLKSKPRLKSVGGNLLIFVPGVATWTIVTSGPHFGVHEGASDDDVHCAMSCDDDLLLKLFVADDAGLDLPEEIRTGRLKFEGDLKVFVRFVELMG